MNYGIIEKMAKKEGKKAKPGTLIVKSGTILGSTYAQIVGVVVTDIDITLEFVYKNPRPEIKEAQVVARVTLPVVAGRGLANSIIDTIKVHEKKASKKS